MGSYKLTKVSSVVLAIATALPSLALSQRETIPEALARGSTGRFRTAGSGKAPSIDQVLAKTDLLVRGVLGKPRAYLSKDQRDVYTEYVLLNPVVLFGPELVTTPKPTVLPVVKVTQLGGTITLNGLEFVQTEDGLPPLEAGTEGLFLLERVGDRHMIAGTFYGAFRVASGKLTPLARTQGFALEYTGLPVERAAAGIVERLRNRRR